MADRDNIFPRLIVAAIVVSALFAGGVFWLMSDRDGSPDVGESEEEGRVASLEDRDRNSSSGRTSPNENASPGPIGQLVEAADSVVNGDSDNIQTGPTRTIELAGGGTVDVPADSAAAKAMEARKTAERLEAQAMADPGPTGPEHWAAPVSPAEQAKIQAAFDALPEPDPRVSRADRKTSIEVARALVEECYRDLEARHPGRQGRVAVAWTAMAARGQGVITEPEITLNLKLRDPAFEQCIVVGLDGLTFPAAEPGEPLRVEYPFFFDR